MSVITTSLSCSMTTVFMEEKPLNNFSLQRGIILGTVLLHTCLVLRRELDERKQLQQVIAAASFFRQNGS